MRNFRTKIGKGGRLVIPSQYRNALGLQPGDEVTMVLEDEELKILSPRQAIDRAQRLVRHYIPKQRNLSGELIRERRKEAKHE